MKKLIFFSVLLFIGFVFSSFLQVNTSCVLIHNGKVDNLDYQLNIIEANISPLKDTVFGGNQCFITKCPLTLTNNTNDTLKYAGMSASWWEFYSVHNNNFALAEDYWNVFKNGPVVYVLPPHQSVTNNIKIITFKDYFHRGKLRIAMRLQKVVKLPIIGEIKSIDSDSNFLIWSNEVTVR